jgi:hypothetical protein
MSRWSLSRNYIPQPWASRNNTNVPLSPNRRISGTALDGANMGLRYGEQGLRMLSCPDGYIADASLMYPIGQRKSLCEQDARDRMQRVH